MSAQAIHERARADRLRLEAIPLPANVPSLVFSAAEACPDEIALSFFEDSWELTYKELADRVKALAAGLATVGIGHGSHVGVMVTNKPAFPVTWFALLSLGAVMVPINTRYTARELDYVLTKADASHLVIEAGILGELGLSPERLPVPAEHVVLVGAHADGLHRSWEELELRGASAPHDLPAVVQSDIANIQFTSGSTGFPKGCVQTHRFWLEAALLMAKSYLPEHKRMLVYQSFFYMDPQFLMLAAIFNRGTAYISRGPSRKHYADWVNQHRIEFAFMPEFVCKDLLERGEKLPTLKRVNIFGWGRENHQLAQAWFPFPLRESFGMTEIGTTLYQPEEAVSMVGSRSCGLEGAYRQCKVMLDLDREAAADEVGELWVKGPGVIKSYYKEAEANEKNFVDGWFRTGDLFCRDGEGFFYYRGRLKDTIRRSGENIAAQEVEAVMRGCPYIVEAAAVAIPDPERGEEVKVFVTCVDGIVLQENEDYIRMIFAACEKDLARFKVPRYIEQIDQFPRTGSNKIDKPKLISERRGSTAKSFDRANADWRNLAG